MEIFTIKDNNYNKTEVGSVQLGNIDIADMDKCPQDKCCMDNYRGDSCNLLYMFPGPFVYSLLKIGAARAEILLSKSLCGGWWWVVCKPILVFGLSLGQAEQ